MLSRLRIAVLLSVALLLGPLSIPAHAAKGGGQDHAGAFTTINISEDQPAGDIACIFCTVNVNGDVHGDVAVLFGTVNATADRTISGDVAVLFSTIRLGEDSHIRGDLASAFSNVDIPSSSTVGGERAIFSSGVGITVLLAPLLLLCGAVWLVIFLVRENRVRRYAALPRRY